MIWASVTFLFFHKWVESIWFICLLDSHLSTHGNLLWATITSQLSFAFIMNVCRFLMAPSRVAVAQFASQQGVMWARCREWAEDMEHSILCFQL